MAADYDTIMTEFSKTWSQDLSQLVGEVESGCPNWEPVRETLLDNPAMLGTLISNKSYGKIGALCSEIRNYVKLLKRVHADRHGLATYRSAHLKGSPFGAMDRSYHRAWPMLIWCRVRRWCDAHFSRKAFSNALDRESAFGRFRF